MAQYIDKDTLVAEIERRIKFFIDCHIDNYEANAGEICGLKRLLDFINTLEVKEDTDHYELKEFAKIIRGNLTGISKDVQSLFEAKYLQLTDNKMYGGYKD